MMRLVQDGGVEGHALTTSCESTIIKTNCWTIINRKTLEVTKKDTPHTKTKEKPQWDGRRGTITISNPITAGWVTHKLENTYTTEVHPLEWRFWAPYQASQPGGPATGGGIPRESDFEGYRDLISGLWQDRGKQRLHSWRAHTKESAHRDPGERAVTPGKTEPDLPASVGGSSAEAGGGCGSPWGQGHWQQKFWEVLLGMSPPRVRH